MRKTFDFIAEAIGWLQIAASPLAIGLGIGALVYFPKPSTTRLVIGISIAALGLIIGVIWATKIWKTTGTLKFMSRLTATPELDEEEE